MIDLVITGQQAIQYLTVGKGSCFGAQTSVDVVEVLAAAGEGRGTILIVVGHGGLLAVQCGEGCQCQPGVAVGILQRDVGTAVVLVRGEMAYVPVEIYHNGIAADGGKLAPVLGGGAAGAAADFCLQRLSFDPIFHHCKGEGVPIGETTAGIRHVVFPVITDHRHMDNGGVGKTAIGSHSGDGGDTALVCGDHATASLSLVQVTSVLVAKSGVK